MRLFLEWLGLVEPDRSRREPIAVPAWAPYAVAAVATAAITALSLASWLLLRIVF